MDTVFRTLVALLGFTALILGGTAAPASATSEHPTPVYFAGVHNAPRTLDLYDIMPDDTIVRQELGTVVEHPKTVCPKNGKYRLVWGWGNKRILDERFRLAAGECFHPGPGPTVVHVWRVK